MTVDNPSQVQVSPLASPQRASFLTSLSTLQLLAVLLVVVCHLWQRFLPCDKDVGVPYLAGLAVSFCFVYSGFFTARGGRFTDSYTLSDHGRYLMMKLSRFYPMYVVALLMCYVAFGGFSVKPFLVSMAMLNPFVPVRSYYFGANAVGWFLCAMMFIYLVSPWVVRWLGRLAVRWQMLLLALLLVLQVLGGYFEFLDSYLLYQFPPMRVIDFATGVLLYNLTCTATYARWQSRLTSRRATGVEWAAVLLAIPLCWLGCRVHDLWCFRAWCTMVAPVCLLLGAFVFTSAAGGWLSRMLSAGLFRTFSRFSSEIYIFQIAVYFCLVPWLDRLGMGHNSLSFIAIQWAALFVFSWMFHELVTRRSERLLRSCQAGRRVAR